MGEGRELFERFAANLKETHADFVTVGMKEIATVFGGVLNAAETALATQPAPVPELPEYVKHCEGGWHRIEFANGDSDLMDSSCDLGDLDRIAEAARILAARERARRAGR